MRITFKEAQELVNSPTIYPKEPDFIGSLNMIYEMIRYSAKNKKTSVRTRGDAHCGINNINDVIDELKKAGFVVSVEPEDPFPILTIKW